MIMMRRIFFRILPLALTLSAATATASAENTAVRTAVNRFMRGYSAKLVEQYGADLRVEYTITALDSQPIADCPAPLALNAKDAGQLTSRISVQVNCPGGWSIYVPIDLSIYRPVVTALKPLAPGTTIGDDDVQLVEADITQLLGQYLTNLDEAVGMSAKRAIMAGKPVIAPQLAPPLLIHRGDSVVINADSGGISVKSAGTALTDGRRGEQIRIKNQGSARVIDARVTGSGEVQAAM
jgi:flagella basal body P-ring formation protein FlgA